jgi:3D (Asp-Asp-Asp) domain-containing protein
MNVYLLQLVGKWIEVFFVAVLAISPGFRPEYQTFQINNKSKDMSLDVITEVIEFDTHYIYNKKLPSNIENIITEGKDGLAYFSLEDSETRIAREPIDEVIELGTGRYGIYRGTLTGYGPDCRGCSPVGNVSCRTREKTNHSLTSDGIYYNDTEYGSLRILAATRTVFPCGTVILVDNGYLEPFYAVVLDTGHTMREAWNNEGRVWMDLAFESQKAVKDATSYKTKFSVQRWGW